jgi:hypothetical protein
MHFLCLVYQTSELSTVVCYRVSHSPSWLHGPASWERMVPHIATWEKIKIQNKDYLCTITKSKNHKLKTCQVGGCRKSSLSQATRQREDQKVCHSNSSMMWTTSFFQVYLSSFIPWIRTPSYSLCLLTFQTFAHGLGWGCTWRYSSVIHTNSAILCSALSFLSNPTELTYTFVQFHHALFSCAGNANVSKIRTQPSKTI